ncbi:zinc finger protein ZFAT-like isoform X2 [Tribolium madens]|uniref:zinc finger protein ZFAT-like isoform X2 n=1 Tax=Tribolium madens TaxID=41895 RepID=UPI001CF75729|nr:zinc finger protein ZFAT-like isoform X2 [Tribolium madens]
MAFIYLLPTVTNSPIVEMKQEVKDMNLDAFKTEIKQEPLDHWSTVLVKEEPIEEKVTKEEPEKSGKVFTCPHCPYSTGWKSNLGKHIVSRHTSSDQINWLQCPQCPYRGKTRDYLKCHLIHVHSIAVKWYPCPQCPFKAKMKRLLDRHLILTHTDSEEIEWFQCEHCPFKAKFSYSLKQHIFSRHTDDSAIKWFQCDLCEFKAKRKRNLQLHQLHKHTNEREIKWFYCDSCDCKFKRKQSLRSHVATVHNKRKFETREIPVFIDNQLCWRRIVVEKEGPEAEFKCNQCAFATCDKIIFKQHVLKTHTVTEIKKEDDCIVKKTYKTKDVVVMVGDVPCVKKVIDGPL